MGEVLSAIGIVLGAIFLMRAAAGAWFRRSARGRGLRVVESCPLGQQQRLHVVEVHGERLLVGSAEGRVSLLQRLPAPPEPPVEEPAREEPGPDWSWRAGLRAWLRAAGGTVPLLLVIGGSAASAAEPGSASSLGAVAGFVNAADAATPERISTTLEIVALMTLVSLAPSILLMATCFTRIIIVLSLLRQAIGVNQLPPNQVLVGLALFLTVAVMAPIAESVHDQALAPYVNREIDAPTALSRAAVPAREFLFRHTREKDLGLFVSLTGEPIASREDVSLSILLPSYMISELRTAFEIGFMVFLPFLIIDLVIASTLISMGMIVLPPIVISLPFKLMLFVLLDGWNLIASSLMKGLM